jgi:hypothetical protein
VQQGENWEQQMVSEARPNGSPASPDGFAADPTTEAREPPNPWEPLVRHIQELLEYFSYYLSVRADQARFRVRRLLLVVMAGVMAACVAIACVVTAAVLFLAGFAEMLGRLFGDRIWLGNIVTGVLFLGALGLGIVYLARRITHTSFRRTVQKYAERRDRQRSQFGRDVSPRG